MAEGERKVILVADDEQAVRNLIASALSPLNSVLLQAADGNSAMEVSEWHKGDIDLLITDIKMPGYSGKELAEKLCRARPKLKVLYISGYSEIEVVDLTQCNNKDTYFLRKPFTLAAFVSTVKEILEEGQAGSD